jgi:hypothetical protein
LTRLKGLSEIFSEIFRRPAKKSPPKIHGPKAKPTLPIGYGSTSAAAIIAIGHYDAM